MLIPSKNNHITTGLILAEKIERCRAWLPGGKFLHEKGSEFRLQKETVLDKYRRERATRSN